MESNEKKGANPESDAQSMLSDITRGLYHAASTTNSMLAQQYITLLEQFFDRENEQFVPKTVELNLPNGSVIYVPLIAFVSPKGIALENMKVSMSMIMTEAGLTAATHELDGLDITRTRLKVELAPRSRNKENRDSNIVDVDIEFKACDPPEGIMRILDQFYQSVISVNPPENPEILIKEILNKLKGIENKINKKSNKIDEIEEQLKQLYCLQDRSEFVETQLVSRPELYKDKILKIKDIQDRINKHIHGREAAKKNLEKK